MRDLMAGNDPGPITFRLKRSRKADETFPLRLTQQEREHDPRHPDQEQGEGVPPTSRGRHVGRQLHLEGTGPPERRTRPSGLYAPGPDKKRLMAVLHKVTDLLSEEHASVLEGVVPMTRKTAPKTGDLIYQFKVTMLDIKPAIWQRIQVPDCTLADLHEYIQAAFGWWNYYMHQFDIDGERYGPPAPDDMDFGLEIIDEMDMPLSKLIPKSGRKPRWIYEYDFGDGWRHEVLFEGCLRAERGKR